MVKSITCADFPLYMSGRRQWVLVKAKSLFDYEDDDDEEETDSSDVEDMKDLMSTMIDEQGNLLPEFGGAFPPLPPKPKTAAPRASRARKVRVKAPAKAAPAPAPTGPDGTHLAVVGDMNWGKIPEASLLPFDPDNRLEEQYGHMGVIDDKMSEWVNQHGMPDSIITGGTGAIDQMVEQWANDNGVPVTAIPPDFETHGKFNALPMRNQRMLENATHVLGLNHPMGDSGTMNAIEQAMRSGKTAHLHNLLAHPSTPLKPVGRGSGETERSEDWYREFIGDDRDVRGRRVRVITPAQREKLDEMPASQRLQEAIGRVHGREFKTGRMNLQSKRQREAGVKDTERVEGLPMRAPLSRYTTRSLPRDERTEEEKENDRLLDMARELGEGMGGNVIVEGEKTQERTPQQQMLDRRREREKKNAERAAGNLPVDPKGSVQTPEQKRMEDKMRDDMAAFAEGGKKRGTPPASRRKAPTSAAKRAAPSKSLFDIEDDDDDQKNAGEPMDIAWSLLKAMLAKLDWDEEPEMEDLYEGDLEERLRQGRSRSQTQPRPMRSIRQENERARISEQNEDRWGTNAAGKNQRPSSADERKRQAKQQKIAQRQAREARRKARREMEERFDATTAHPGSPLTNEEYMSGMTDIRPHQTPLPYRHGQDIRPYPLEWHRPLESVFDSLMNDYDLDEETAADYAQKLIDGDITYDMIDRRANRRLGHDIDELTEMGFLRNDLTNMLSPASSHAGHARDLRLNTEDAFDAGEFMRRVMSEKPHLLDGSLPDELKHLPPEILDFLRQTGQIPSESGITLQFDDEGNIEPEVQIISNTPEDDEWLRNLQEELENMPRVGRRQKDANVAFANPTDEPDMDSGAPETLGINVPGEYDQNQRRQLVESFQGLPWNEETGFTMGEPMDVAWDSLLKKR